MSNQTMSSIWYYTTNTDLTKYSNINTKTSLNNSQYLVCHKPSNYCFTGSPLSYRFAILLLHSYICLYLSKHYPSSLTVSPFRKMSHTHTNTHRVYMCVFMWRNRNITPQSIGTINRGSPYVRALIFYFRVDTADDDFFYEEKNQERHCI